MELKELMESFWKWRLSQSPEFGSFAGHTEYDGDLEEFTLERFEKDGNTCRDFLQESKRVICRNEEDEINLKIFQSQLTTFIDGLEFRGFYYPICYLEGVQVDFERLGGEWMTLKSKIDYENLIKRYSKFRRYVSQIIDMLRLAIQEKKVYHEISMKGVLSQIRNHLSDNVKETVFWKPFDKLSKDLDDDLIRNGEAAIRDFIQPGFRDLEEFLKTEYLPKTRPEIGCSTLPNGKNMYRQLLKFHTSTDLSPEEIHKIGLDEVAKIEREMRKIAEETGHGNKSLKEFADMLRNDKRFLFASREDILESFTDTVINKINPHLEKLFWKPPQSKLDIVPSTNPDSPAAFYIVGTVDGSRPGRFYVNVHQYDSIPKYEMISLALHEANPGHHLQSSYNLEQPQFPSFRRVMEDRIYTQCPSRFPIDTAYGEGWALYCETLGKEMGLYNDPYDRYGHLSESAFRACRLVVDTGMHALGWTREMAVEYMLEHTASSKTNIENEIARYITWPGQATGYKIGQIKIMNLREKAQEVLKDKFDLRDFHEVILKTAGPLNVVEYEVEKFIQRTLTA